jgi:uncharacterized cupin superfamily protein
MKGVERSPADTTFQGGYLAPSCEADGPVRSTLFHPAEFSLWEVEAELAVNAELHWGSQHGDEVIFVLGGELDFGSSACGPGESAIIEAGVATTARVVSECRVAHFGPASADAATDSLLGPPLDEGRRVHVKRPEDAPSIRSDDGLQAVYYADSTCPTCRLTFFEVSCGSSRVVSSHTHSQDEIIRVMTGELRIGRASVIPGMSVAIPGGYRYGFRTPGSFSFLNYRRDASLYVGAPGATPILEGGGASRRSGSGEELG